MHRTPTSLPCPQPSEPLPPPPPPRSYQQILSLPAFSFIVCCLITIINSLISCFPLDCARSSHGCPDLSPNSISSPPQLPPRPCPVQGHVSAAPLAPNRPSTLLHIKSAAPQGRRHRSFPSRRPPALVSSLSNTEQHDPAPLTEPCPLQPLPNVPEHAIVRTQMTRMLFDDYSFVFFPKSCFVFLFVFCIIVTP